MDRILLADDLALAGRRFGCLEHMISKPSRPCRMGANIIPEAASHSFLANLGLPYIIKATTHLVLLNDEERQRPHRQ